VNGLRLALGFLTALPVRPPGALRPGDLGRAAAWFPLVGLALGSALWAAYHGLSVGMPQEVTGALVVAGWAVLTGGLHLDGLADCCDGLLGSVDRQRRLAIMQDPRRGAFGVVGVSLLLLLKFAAVAGLADGRGLILVPILGRSATLVVARLRPARAEGLGAAMQRELRGWVVGLSLAVSTLGAAWFGGRGAAALILAYLTAFGVGALARARLGGQTGDVLGATCELAEAAALLAFAWRAP